MVQLNILMDMEAKDIINDLLQQPYAQHNNYLSYPLSISFTNQLIMCEGTDVHNNI